jgi:hypothetical protein
VEEMQLSNCVMAGQSLQMQTPTLLKSLGWHKEVFLDNFI